MAPSHHCCLIRCCAVASCLPPLRPCHRRLLLLLLLALDAVGPLAPFGDARKDEGSVLGAGGGGGSGRSGRSGRGMPAWELWMLVQQSRFLHRPVEVLFVITIIPAGIRAQHEARTLTPCWGCALQGKHPWGKEAGTWQQKVWGPVW